MCIALIVVYSCPTSVKAATTPVVGISVNFDGVDYVVNVQHLAFANITRVLVQEKANANAPITAAKYDETSNTLCLSENGTSPNISSYSFTEEDSIQLDLMVSIIKTYLFVLNFK